MKEAKIFMNLSARVCLCYKEQPSVLLPQETGVILFACMLCVLSPPNWPTAPRGTMSPGILIAWSIRKEHPTVAGN